MTSAADAPARAAKTSVMGRIAATYLAPRWKGLLVAAACAVAFAVLSGLLAKSLQPAINGLKIHQSREAAWHWPLLLAAFALARGVVQVVQAMLVNRIGNGVVGDIQLDLFGRLVRADLARLRASHTGGFLSSVLYDAGLIREAATSGIVNFLQQGLTLAAMAVVMASTDWRLALLVLLATPLVAAVLRRYSRRSVTAAAGAMATTSDLSTAIMEEP